MIEPQELTLVTPAGGALELTVRTMRADEYEQCEELQRHTWGKNFRELVPASVLMINQKLGGVVAGAFDPEGRMLAFLLGQTGVRRGRLFHWSHMLAVRNDLRGLGLGRHLKLFQRRFLLELGVEEAEWTYDPLESRNGHLNLNRLGAEPVEYLRDVYGDGSTSGLHSGIGTDRFVVRWHIGDPQVRDRIEGRLPADRQGRDAPVVNVDHRGSPSEPPFELPDLPALRVEIPSDVQAVKSESMEVARRWRSSTRYAFEILLPRGYRVPRLDYDRETRRSFYVLLKR